MSTPCWHALAMALAAASLSLAEGCTERCEGGGVSIDRYRCVCPRGKHYTARAAGDASALVCTADDAGLGDAATAEGDPDDEP